MYAHSRNGITGVYYPHVHVNACKRIQLNARKEEVFDRVGCIYVVCLGNKGSALSRSCLRILACMLFSSLPLLSLSPRPQSICACGLWTVNDPVYD